MDHSHTQQVELRFNWDHEIPQNHGLNANDNHWQTIFVIKLFRSGHYVREGREYMLLYAEKVAQKATELFGRKFEIVFISNNLDNGYYVVVPRGFTLKAYQGFCRWGKISELVDLVSYTHIQYVK